MENNRIAPISAFVEYTGRWEICDEYAAATACGSSFRLGFCGDGVLLCFDTSHCQPALPHIYVSVDGGAACECVAESYVRVWAKDSGTHEICVTIKSAVETQDRWYDPVAAVKFTGAVGTGAAPSPDTRPIIEFVGDSITEGNSVFPHLTPIQGARWIENLVYTNDIMSSYSYQTAKRLNMRAVFFGYGSTGIMCSGGGGVPRVADAYGFIRNGVKYCGTADYVVINSGANDRGEDPAEFIRQYGEAVDAIRAHNPHAVIFVVVPFCGAYREELREFCAAYNEKNSDRIVFVDTDGWAPPEPLHPLYETVLAIAEHLSEIIKNAK